MKNAAKNKKEKKIKKGSRKEKTKKIEEKDESSSNQGLEQYIEEKPENKFEAFCEQLQQQQVEGELKTSIQYLQLDSNKRAYACKINSFYKMYLQQSENVEVKSLFGEDQIELNGKLTKQVKINSCFPIFGIHKTTKQKEENILNILIQQSSTKDKKSKKVIQNFVNIFDKAKETLILITSEVQINLIQTSKPFQKLPKQLFSKGGFSNDSLMVIGQKNTGKSTLIDYITNCKGQDQVVTIDCDIGKNKALEGSVSLISQTQTKRIWIGEFSPLNNIQTYLKALRHLFYIYQEKYFTKKLVINTMGYLTGLGEFLVYQIFNIVKPQQILVLEGSRKEKNQHSFYNPIDGIERNLKNGSYWDKLYISNMQSMVSQEEKLISSCQILRYQNLHSESKKSFSRFQGMLAFKGQPIKNITSFLEIIHTYHIYFTHKLQYQDLSCIPRYKISVLNQKKHNKHSPQSEISFDIIDDEEKIDMRIVVLVKLVEEQQPVQFEDEPIVIKSLFEVWAIGFAYNDNIYYNGPSLEGGVMGVVSQGVDFEKTFYTISEQKLIELELKYGRIQYITANIKTLGGKSIRNNPSKKQ